MIMASGGRCRFWCRNVGRGVGSQPLQLAQLVGRLFLLMLSDSVDRIRGPRNLVISRNVLDRDPGSLVTGMSARLVSEEVVLEKAKELGRDLKRPCTNMTVAESTSSSRQAHA